MTARTGARAAASSATMSGMELREDDERYQALRRRDPAAEGKFVYAVATTGIYCRPTCGVRLALRRNVRFFATASDAERAGFRACKRCRPREPARRPHEQLLREARARLETAEDRVTLVQLARAAGLSPHHFHRVFTAAVGMTPHEYAEACRLRRFGEAVRGGATVTAAIHDAGYSSSSRFYEGGRRALGMTPAQLRRGGEGLEIRAVVRACSLGHALVAVTARGVCAVALGADPAALWRELRGRFPRAAIKDADQRARQLATAVVALMDGARTAAEVPLDLVGTAFQQRVWRALRDIPPGETTTYAQLARRIGAPRAVRAVGTACGANPVAVAVPCHRVLRTDGALGGYRWGLARKKALLARERGRR